MIGEAPDQPRKPSKGEQKQPSKAIAVVATRDADAVAGYGAVSASDGINRKLTRKEQAVLKVLMNPEYADKPVIEKQHLADVSNGQWYSILNDPWIKQQQISLCQGFVAQHIAPILEASRKTAVTPGRDGWQDRRWLAEVGGFYIPRRQVEQHTTGKIAIGIVGIDPKDV